MALVVTPNLTEVHDCDAVTGWAGGISQFAVEPAVKVEGTGSLCAWIDATTSAIEYYTITSVDLSNGEHIYVWMNCSGVVDTKANGGYRIVAYSGTAGGSNYMTWYVGGNDTHPAGGWVLMCCDVSATGTETGTFDPTDVVAIGIQFKTLTNAIKKGTTYVQNCFWDIVRYGTGLTITSGATDNIDFDDIYVVDKANAYGVLQKANGGYILTGKLIFGDASGTGSIDFADADQVILVPNNPLLSSTFNGIEVVGNGTGTTNFELTRCNISAFGTEFVIDMTDTDIDVLELTDCSFVGAGTIDFPVDATNRSIDGCSFSGCGQVSVSTCEVINCKFNGCSAPLISSSSHQFSDNILQNATYGLEFDTATTYALSNCVFTNCTTDINNTSGGTVVINASGTTNCSTYTGTTTINNTKSYTITGLIANTEVRAYVGTDPATVTEIDGVESSTTSFQFNHQQGGNDGYIVFNHPDYIYNTTNVLYLTYPSVDATLPITPVIDRNYSNPA